MRSGEGQAPVFTALAAATVARGKSGDPERPSGDAAHLAEKTESFGGAVVSHPHREFLAVFEDAGRAFEAASSFAGASSLAIGLHSSARETSTGSGEPLQTARLLAVSANPGQILSSRAATETMPNGASKVLAKTWGDCRLADLMTAQPVFELGSTTSDDSTDAPVTLDQLPNNLPIQTTRFIGRDSEIRSVKDRIDESRLVTLVGAGGAGKSRLALHVSAEAARDFPGGAWWVDLQVVSEPSAIGLAVAASLGVSDAEKPGQTAFDSISQTISDQRTLMVLDNCEHLVAGCAQLLDRLTRECPNLRVLCTSRESLGLEGEVVWEVPPMIVAGELTGISSDDLSNFDSHRLFLSRAALVNPHFAADETNALPIAGICQRLSGMPLAIELAASRARVITPKEILERLDDQLRLLVSEDAESERHRALRVAVEWSYSLLPPSERVLLQRLAVFSGSFDLEAAEQVCSGGGVDRRDVLGFMGGLVEKSLVTADTRGPKARYRLLEYIKQFAWEKLESPDGRRVDQLSSYQFRRDGDYWAIAFEGSLFRLKHSKGLAYLAALIDKPGQEIHAMDLVTAGSGRGSGRGQFASEGLAPVTDGGDALIDDEARESYRRRLAELDEELREAESWGDAERSAKAQTEIDELSKHLAQATGLSGRARKSPHPGERARVSATKAIKSAISRMEKQSRPLFEHLEATVRTGTFCSYTPDPSGRVKWNE